jgi:hypothetical protein
MSEIRPPNCPEGHKNQDGYFTASNGIVVCLDFDECCTLCWEDKLEGKG